MPESGTVVLSASLLEDLLGYVLARYPAKSFGYLAAPRGSSEPSDFFGFTGNVRNSERWQDDFESRGRYFIDHPDAGFVATEEESWAVQRQLLDRDLREVAMFHTHRRHPGNFSDIDYDLHVSRSAEIWHLIISLRNPRQPQLRAFAPTASGVRELRVLAPAAPATRANIGRDWRGALELDAGGWPKCRDSALIWQALGEAGKHPDLYQELVLDGFLRHAGERYGAHVAPLMVSLGDAEFAMGAPPGEVRHFCGETPRHRVWLSRFLMSRFAVTNRLYALFDPGWAAAGPDLPVVDVSWFDAAVAAAWFGCRLPAEAEWEFACGAGSAAQWCCGAPELPAHAWYSENAGRVRHPVGTREPNAWGLHDLHGNVWEWCQDDYFPDFYRSSPAVDPVATAGGGTRLAETPHKVSRGGGFLALAEMCRTSYRLHDPAGYHAADLGFRLARTSTNHNGG